MTPRKRVFISGPLAKNLAPDHRELREKILMKVEDMGFDLRGFYEPGLADGSGRDFDGLRALIDRCHGVLSLAFPRWRTRDIVGTRSGATTTEYIHMEGALALARSKPLLVVREESVPERALLGNEIARWVFRIPEGKKVGWLDGAWESNKGIPVTNWADCINQTRDVFLGYSSGASSTADQIARFLASENISVLDWRLDFTAGETIFDQVEEAARRCSCGVFLFTGDDRMGDGDAIAAPRDNVIFEAGYFASAKGRSRTVIVLESGAKFPADLGGVIYLALKDRSDTRPIETALRSKLLDIT